MSANTTIKISSKGMEADMPKQKSSKGFFSMFIAALILSAAAQSESTSSLRSVSVDPAELAAFKVATRAKYDMICTT